MPNWNEVLKEIEITRAVHPVDEVRRSYIHELANYTDRNVIAYYSGWLSRHDGNPSVAVNDEDKNAFMTTIHNLDRSKGLDLILHTPGGDIAAAESLVDYLRKMFGTDIRAIVPQLAMSAGTMIACACRTIIMGKQSNLGPIDPQVRGLPANGVLAEFNKAIQQVKADPASAMMWQSIIGKYHPTFLGQCEMAIEWGDRIVREWLVTGMLDSDNERETTAATIVGGLASSEENYAHNRHIHVEKLEELGLKIERMEADARLQDLILTVHHAYMHTFSMTPAVKIVENQNGAAVVRMAAQ